MRELLPGCESEVFYGLGRGCESAQAPASDAPTMLCPLPTEEKDRERGEGEGCVVADGALVDWVKFGLMWKTRLDVQHPSNLDVKPTGDV